MRPLFIVLLAAGCGIVPGTGLGTGTGPRGESFSTSGGICVDDSEPADDVEFDVVYSGAEGNGMPTGPAVQRLTAQEDYDNVQEMLGFTGDPIDFETQEAMLIFNQVGSTCGLGRESLGAVRGDGRLMIELLSNDISGACSSVCDMEAWDAVVVAYDKTLEVEGCARIHNTCQ